MFIIWKNDNPITYDEIAAQYTLQFGYKKSSATIRGIVNDIKRLERDTKRKYLHPASEAAGKTEAAYKVNQEFVDYQPSAVILLELYEGYKNFAPEYYPERKIALDNFKQYIVKKYRWTSSFVRECLGNASDNNYLSFVTGVEPGRTIVSKKDRLYHDLDYLILILRDYCDQNRRKRGGVSRQLEELVSLYRSNEAPRKSAKGNRNGKR